MKNWLKNLVITESEKKEILNLQGITESPSDETLFLARLAAKGYLTQWEYDVMDDDDFIHLWDKGKVDPTDRNINRYHHINEKKRQKMWIDYYATEYGEK